MSPPLLVLLARPNGAGKTSLYETFLAARFPNLPFVNADRIAAERWPGAEVTHGRAASKAAARMRAKLRPTGDAGDIRGGLSVNLAPPGRPPRPATVGTGSTPDPVQIPSRY